MSNGYSAAYDDVIDAKNIEKFCKKEWDKFQDVFKNNILLNLDDYASQSSQGEMEEDYNEVDKKFIALAKQFYKKTGLELSIRYHDADNEGDCYDGVNGAFFGVDGMYQFTPAGKRMQKYVRRETYVIYG